MSAPRKPRGARWWALCTVFFLLYLFVIAAASVWRDNPTLQPLSYVAMVAMLLLLRPLVVLERRAAGAQGERPGDYPEGATRLHRGRRIAGIGLVLLGLYLLTAVSLSWATRTLGLAVVVVGILLVSNSFDLVMRIIGIVLVPLNVFFLGCLYLDAVHGYPEAWPLYTFVAVGLVSVLVWPYLLARAYVRWLRR